jgi:hypothetical protein
VIESERHASATGRVAHGFPLAPSGSLAERDSIRMQDIKSPRVLWLKATLFLFIGLASAGLLFLETPTLRVAFLLALAIWGFCRAYYFAFYVIEHYIDPRFRFSGLIAFLRYAVRQRILP